MTIGSTTHIIYLVVTLAFFVLSAWAVSKMNEKWQNVCFIFGTLICSGGIFFRYGMGLTWEGGITLKTLARELLQVCSFNFVLLPLMLIKKCEIARQYAFFFSMFAACTTLFSVSRSFANVEWYSTTLLNSWLNHVFAIAVPIWMIASRRFKPQKKYVLPVTACVFVYFTVSYVIQERLILNGVMTVENSLSFIYRTMGVPVLDWFMELIPYPYWYLYPLLPLMIGFFYLLAFAFKKYKLKESK